MAFKSHDLPAIFARRREKENMRIERTEEVNRYYDHWGKVTSRFKSWTAPEFYKQAEEKCKQSKEKVEKEAKLTERRERVRKLYAEEKAMYEQEVNEREKHRFRRQPPASNETLKKIEQNAREKEQIRRKLELEAKLYGRWRHGVDDENLIFESKSDHQVLAKLNWLDKQIGEQVEREEAETLAQERNLRMQEEISKTVQTQKERQQIREQEIKEIRALQETHMVEMKARQTESDRLKAAEKKLRSYLGELREELELLEQSAAVLRGGDDLTQAYNLTKIKVVIRKRADVFRNQLKLLLCVLQRVRAFGAKVELNKQLEEKYMAQLEAEQLMLSQIESWYESEAKYNLQRCEEVWQADHLQRYNEVKQLLNEETAALTAQLEENMQRQSEVLEIRATHLTGIDNSNEKLKQLVKEQNESLSSIETEVEELVATTPRATGGGTALKKVNKEELPFTRPSSARKVTNTFNNLNLDVWQESPTTCGRIGSPLSQTKETLQAVTPGSAERPKFGRKRVAWT